MSLGRVTGEAKSMKGTNTKNRIIKGLLGALCVLNLAAVGSVVRETIKDKISAQNMKQMNVTCTADEKVEGIIIESAVYIDSIVIALAATIGIIGYKEKIKRMRAECREAEKEENEEKYKL